MSRFLFLLFVCGFACSLSNGVVIAMMSDGSDYGGEDSSSYENDSYNNGGGYSGNNGMMNNGGMIGNGGDMRSQVRSIVDNILQLNQRGDQFYNNNNGPYNNGGYDNSNYTQYGHDNGYQQNGNGSYQSQNSQQWNNSQYNDENQYSNGNHGGYNGNSDNSNSNYQNSNAQNRNNEAIELADNREVNQRIEKAINELNTLKKNVNQRFSQIQQQRNERNGGRNDTDANKDKKTGKDSNKNMLAEKKVGKGSSRWRNYHRNKGKCNKQIFTVKNIDTCNMRTNSYLTLKSKYGSKYHVNNYDYGIKSYSSKKHNKSTKSEHITYKIKSYSKNADEKTSTELAALDGKKYTVKNNSYFAHKDGCPKNNKCG